MEVLNVFIVLITILILLGLGFVLLISYILAKTKTAKNKPIQKASNKYIDAHKLLLETMEMAQDTSTSGYSRDI